jgi:putative Mg2+ transporter-C (MgtC) family protein
MRNGTPWRRLLPDLSSAEILLRVGLAAILGGAIGFERELREREAGLRTHLLVSVGAALFTMVSAYAWTDWRFSTEEGLVFDPTRVAAQVVTGIGFLGAGAIIRQGLSVKGLTTAATLWVVAAIGMASGAGYYVAAVITTVLVLVSLWPLRIVAFRISGRFRPEEGRLAIELPAGASAVSLLEAVEGAGAVVRSLEFEEEGDSRRVDLRVRIARGRSAAHLLDALTRAQDVKGARWNP